VTSGDAFAAFERSGWESGRASPYHRGLGAMTSRPIPAMLDAAAVGTGSAVLDVATGSGYAAALAAERGAEVVAVDLSREMLDLAAELHPEIEFRQAPVRGRGRVPGAPHRGGPRRPGRRERTLHASDR
jgi:protein-L-isoaspartate O-methyltransferase